MMAARVLVLEPDVCPDCGAGPGQANGRCPICRLAGSAPTVVARADRSTTPGGHQVVSTSRLSLLRPGTRVQCPDSASVPPGRLIRGVLLGYTRSTGFAVVRTQDGERLVEPRDLRGDLRRGGR